MYYNQRKNVRQIAQEARISFRDIAAILKKKEAASVVNGSIIINERELPQIKQFYGQRQCKSALSKSHS